jgi:hypothetical protein
VFVSGYHPDTWDWHYVTGVAGETLVSGYVQHFRIATDLPEPLATLHAIASGDRLEPIAARIYAREVIPGRDLRF